ncbi:DUF1317 family protein [Raoultella ornithinolytica]|uniref:DUF1317 family protein n=1 Tax=Raoultella ornithinolytica TaxID=54291 RepID=UPI00384CE01E
MKHHRDAITVGKVKCMYSVIRRGWLMPWGEVVRNPFKAQRLAEPAIQRHHAIREEGSHRERQSDRHGDAGTF